MKMKWLLYILLFSLLVMFFCAKVALASVVVVDTLYPIANGIKDEWTGNIPHWGQIDESTSCASGDSLKGYNITTDKYYSYLVASSADSRFYPWIDSTVMEWCGNATGNCQVLFGRSKNIEGFFGWCGDTTRLVLAASSATLYKTSCLDDACTDTPWSAYNILLNEWAMLKIAGTGIANCHASHVLLYSTYPDTLPTGEPSVYFAQASALICSTWGTSNCNNTDSCLKSFSRDFRTKVLGQKHGWTITNPNLPANTKIDSVECWYNGYSQGSGADSIIGIGYFVKGGDTCAVYGLDTISLYGEAASNGEFKKKVWTTCPATGLAWTESDLVSATKGFGVVSLLATYVALDWWRMIVFVSYQEAAGINPRPARIYDNGNIARIYDNGNIFNLFK